jgi:phospholipid/cholesterol/gamma-HCH transport system substrate-binding protein
MRRIPTGMDPLRAGLIALVLIAIFSYFAFSKDLPFVRGYRIQAVFHNTNLVQPRTPVRIAGVDVGEVKEAGRYRDTHLSVVTMEIRDNGRPIHSDATIKIRSRMFLEGNFYLDLEPGTPDAKEIPDGGIIPVSQTSWPVQLDQVLTGLQSDTREGLQQTLRGLGTAFSSKPTAEDDADQDPDVGGLTGTQALNKALETSVGALRDSAIANDALLGDAPHDMSRLIEGIARTSRGLGEHEQALRDLVSDFNTTMAAMASRAPELSETVRLLGPTAANARLGFASIERALPPSSAFARELIPGVEETPATIAASRPWLTQAEKLFGPAELGGLLDELGPATRHLAGLGHKQLTFLPEVHLFNRCSTDVLLPVADLRVDDGPLSAGTENYKEFWYAMVGQAGEGQSFDGNGTYLRLAAPGGAQTIETGKTNYTGRSLFGKVTTPPLRTRPAFPGNPPPLSRDVPCHRNPVPDVNGPASIGPADGSRPDAPPSPVPPISAEPRR